MHVTKRIEAVLTESEVHEILVAHVCHMTGIEQAEISAAFVKQETGEVGKVFWSVTFTK